MSRQSASMIAIPRIQFYGAGDTYKRNGLFSFEGIVGDDIADFGKQFYHLHKGSITLGGQAALFQASLAAELGEAPEPSGDIGRVLSNLFERMDRGNVTDDACDYNGGVMLKKVKPTDRSVRWIVRPEGFVQGANGMEARLGADSNEHFILVPEPGYVEWTCDGGYHPILGVPFSTVNRRADAVKSWTDRGFTPEFAEKAVSYFWSRGEGKGTAAVIRWYGSKEKGRFGVIADLRPEDESSTVGSLRAIQKAQ